MRIGVVCYPTYGGSGVVATELGRCLAVRGHQVHFMAYDRPFRLATVAEENLRYHRVELLDYPVFPAPSYMLALAVKIAEIARKADLDVIHAHYAVPHALSAYLARQMLAPRRVAVVTTLHGTDVTLVGRHPSLREAVQFAIEQSDAVTAVSNWLRDQTVSQLDIRKPIAVVPNFVDPAVFVPRPENCPLRCLAGAGEKILLHISNFRPVKRVCDIVRAFARIRPQVAARLLLVGDGPDRDNAEHLADKLGLLDSTCFLGQHGSPECFYATASLFLLPSDKEAFGLAALEAMSAGVPVIGYAAGGLTEVVRDGETGFLVPLGDFEAIAQRSVELLRNDARADEMGRCARQIVLENYLPDHIVPQYEKIYREASAEP